RSERGSGRDQDDEDDERLRREGQERGDRVPLGEIRAAAECHPAKPGEEPDDAAGLQPGADPPAGPHGLGGNHSPVGSSESWTRIESVSLRTPSEVSSSIGRTMSCDLPRTSLGISVTWTGIAAAADSREAGDAAAATRSRTG